MTHNFWDNLIPLFSQQSNFIPDTLDVGSGPKPALSYKLELTPCEAPIRFKPIAGGRESDRAHRYE